MATDLAVQTPADLEQEVSPLVAWAKGLKVTTPDECAAAGDRLKAIKGAMTRVVAFFKPMKQKADETKKAILDAEKKLAEPLQEAEGLAKRAIIAFQNAEQEKARAEQRRLQAEADERARREQEALLKKAQAAKKPETQQRYQEAAAAVTAPVVAVAPSVPKVSGITTKLVWRAKVIDAAKVPREYLMVDEKKLDGYAKAMKEGAKVEGVQFYTESILSASGR